MRQKLFLGRVYLLPVDRTRFDEFADEKIIAAVKQCFGPMMFLVREYASNVQVFELVFIIRKSLAVKYKIARCYRLSKLVKPARYEFLIVEGVSEMFKVIIQVLAFCIGNAVVKVNILFLQPADKGFDT